MLLLFATALAFDASVSVDVEAGVRVRFDGELLLPPTFEEPLVTHRTAAGPHTVELVDASGATRARATVHLPRGYRVDCVQRGRSLACPAASVRHHDPVELGVWGLDDGPVLTVDSGGQHLDLWVDGERRLALRNEPLAHVRIAPGRHHLSLREPGADRGFADGEIDTGERAHLALALNDGGQPVWADGVRWASGGGNGVPGVARPRLSDVGGSAIVLHDLDQPAVSIGGLGQDAWTAPEPPTAVGEATVELALESTDGTWADLLVDGEVVAEVRESRRDVVELPAGRHEVAFRTFLAEAPYATGTLDTTGRTRILVQLAGTERPRTATGGALALDSETRPR